MYNVFKRHCYVLHCALRLEKSRVEITSISEVRILHTLLNLDKPSSQILVTRAPACQTSSRPRNIQLLKCNKHQINMPKSPESQSIHWSTTVPLNYKILTKFAKFSFSWLMISNGIYLLCKNILLTIILCYGNVWDI